MMDVDQAAKVMKDAEIEGEIEIRTKEVRRTTRPISRTMQRFRLFGQLPGRNKLKSPGSRLLVSPFPEIKFILSC